MNRRFDFVRACPVCSNPASTPTVDRFRLPVLQNRVYARREEALHSPTAPFRLHTCNRCGFSFNGPFDSTLVVYDEHYDNDVPSAAFRRYYEELARQLIERFDLRNGTVYEVGCGKGTFLEVLCRLAPGVTGIGVDPSCAPISTGNLSLVKDVFRPELVAPDARLVLLRHVLEHMESPVSLLRAIATAAPSAPLFVEVPDLDWIFANGTFWDFCYEHCNYFTPTTLAHAMSLAGYRVEAQLSLFAGQFQGITGTPAARAESYPISDASAATAAAAAYASSENARIGAARARVEAASGSAVLWGMATKGVVFASLMDGAPLAGGVDVNAKKQGHFAPGSGLSINAPAWLSSIDRKPTIFIMNSNYAAEIRGAVSDLGVEADFVDL